jgi:hypothetical protein
MGLFVNSLSDGARYEAGWAKTRSVSDEQDFSMSIVV